jgi:DNA transformation protein
MASTQSTVDYLLDQLSGTGQVSARKMFGEYCLYFAGTPVALICDDQLFIKSTAVGKSMISEIMEGSPYPGAKLHLLIPTDKWEDSEWLCQLVKATAKELPQPKPRRPKASQVKHDK